MKLFAILIFTLSLPPNSYGQYMGSITSKIVETPGRYTNVYYYHPPKHILIPDKIYASVVYRRSEGYYYDTTPIHKIRGQYQFLYVSPDSVSVLIISIHAKGRKVIDNNNELGYILYLKKNKIGIPASTYLDAIDLLSYYARITLSLDKEKLVGPILKLFESCYKQKPSIKKQSGYYNYYLSLLYEKNKVQNKPFLLAYAKQMAADEQDEKKWLNALYIYRILSMNNEYKEIESKAISTYSDGKVAKSIFLDNLYNDVDSTEQSILDKESNYIRRFNDTSIQMKYAFNYNIISLLLRKREYGKLSLYEARLIDKLGITTMYNFIANKLSNEHIAGKDTNLIIARMLLFRSLSIIKKQIEDIPPKQNDGILQNAYIRYIDSYAQILYKLGEFDSAFFYQSSVYMQDVQLDVSLLEHFSLYAERVKGEMYAFQYIQSQFRNGVTSLVMLNQLRSICKKLGIQHTVYDSIMHRTINLARINMSNEIKNKFGTLKGKMFKLKSIKGESISTLALKNKIIVLDFWASWCVPCKASFPLFQEVINKYKNDTGVVFLFIDTWENKSPQKMLENAKTFIENNNYSFQVLLDDKNKVANMYRVNVIPFKFIIDKNGDIVFMGDSSNISLEIENAKNKIE